MFLNIDLIIQIAWIFMSVFKKMLKYIDVWFTFKNEMKRKLKYIDNIKFFASPYLLSIASPKLLSSINYDL